MKRTISKIVDYAIRISEPEMIVLFGSMATGAIHPGSDVDLLILSENTENTAYAKAAIKNFTAQLSLKSDVLIYSSKSLREEMKKKESFIRGILKSGTIVYSNKRRSNLKV